MHLPTQRLTITVSEYQLLKPGLDVLSNGLANAKAGNFPHQNPWHRIDCVASDVYRDREFDEEMAVRIDSVRGKVWDLSHSRKIRLDVFEISIMGLATRLSKSQKLVDCTESISSRTKSLQEKIEIYRRRAARSATRKIGTVLYQSAAKRWRRFVDWLRYNALYVKLPKRGEVWRADLWREQRMQLTERSTKS
jgi:hypothetical protein